MANKVITGKVRASFVHVFEPQSINGSEPKYSCSLIIPKSDTDTVGKIREAIEQAKQEGVPKWGGKIPPNLKLPLRDGDVDRPDDPAYENSYFINATSQEQPGVVDRKRVKITDPLAIYVVMNDDLVAAVEDVVHIISTVRRRTMLHKKLIDRINATFVEE